MACYGYSDKGCTFWFKDPGMTIRHREDGPAIEYANGYKVWCKNGNFHREDGPAVEYADGTKRWYLNGLLHREDGPAYEFANGDKFWYKNNKLHREDGPAVEYVSRNNKVWFLDDVRYSEEEFNKKMTPVVEMTMADIEKLVGKKVKIVR